MTGRRIRAWLLGLLASTAGFSGAGAADWTEEPVTADAGTATLHGTLIRPAGAARADAILLQAGSGPSDRDGNMPGMTSNALALLARALGERGIATLRTDKRGVGRSAAAMTAESGLTPALYAADVAAWAARLREDARIGRIFLAGHSEGALIVTLAAADARPAGLILIAGAGFPIAQVIRRQLAALGTPPPLLAEAERILFSLEAGRPSPGASPPLQALFRDSVQPYLISWFRYDPAAELAKHALPTLVLQGTTDLQITVGDAQRLAAARDGIRLQLVDGMNHMLKPAPAEPFANFATYNEPDLPVSADLVDAIAGFVRP